MATNTQTDYTHATVLSLNGEVILTDPFHEDWDSEYLCAHSTGILAFVRGYARAAWGKDAKINRDLHAIVYTIEVKGDAVANIRSTTYDLSNAEQAAFCGCGVYSESSRRLRSRSASGDMD